MLNRKQNSYGFGSLGILLVILTVAVIGFGGWYVFQRNQTSDARRSDTTNSENKTDQTSTKKDDATYLTVTELGIRMRLSEPIKDAYYRVKSGKVNGKPVIALYLHSLDQYQHCTPQSDSGGFAHIGTFVPGAQDEVYDDMETTFPNAPLINGLHYYVGLSQDDCTEGAVDRGPLRDAFKAAYPTIEAL